MEVQLTIFFPAVRKNSEISSAAGMQTWGRWKALNGRFLKLV